MSQKCATPPTTALARPAGGGAIIQTMRTLRGEEEWARLTLIAELGVPVEQHDDGTQPGMYDLEIAYPDRVPGAVEVTMALDPESHVLWNLVNGGDGVWILAGLDGGWMVTLEPTARAARLRNHLPGLLRDLEAVGIRQLQCDENGGDQRERSARALGSLAPLKARRKSRGACTSPSTCHRSGAADGSRIRATRSPSGSGRFCETSAMTSARSWRRPVRRRDTRS